jgi:hypothetical protein
MKTPAEKVGPQCENLDFSETISAWNIPKINALTEAGLVMYECFHSSNEALCIPQGWLVLESTLPGVGHHNGIRKACFSKDKSSIHEFESTLQLFRASAKDVSRSAAILDKLKERESAVRELAVRERL